MLILFTIVIILIGIYLYLASNEQIPPNTKLMPYKNGFPILGVLPFIKPSTYIYFNELKEKLGPIFQVKIGIRKTIVLNDINWFKKCFKEQANIFSGRHAECILKQTGHYSGVFLIDNELWAKSRSFAMRVLRDFGMGKSRSQDIINRESNQLIKELSTYPKDSIVNFGKIITVSVSNVISQFLMNKRYQKDDEDIELIKYLVTNITKFNEPIQLFEMMFPFVENWEWYKKLSLYLFKYTKTFEKVHDIFRKEARLHEKELENKSEPEDLMDRFIMERNKYSKDEIPPEFVEFQMIRLCLEIYAAGYETTSNSIIYGLVFMSHFPEVQEKVYNEIHEKIGTERIPSINDKKDMHYTQAVMDEMMRLTSVVPLAVLHRTLDNCLLDDYYIPKGTTIIPNIYACHRDKNVWEKPDTFYPEHFLTEDYEYKPREALVPFGMGKRQCLGEGLARMEIFILFVHILQNFRVELPEKVSEQEYQDCMTGIDTIIRYSSLEEFKFFKR